MKVSQIKVEHVYRGVDGKDRLVMHTGDDEIIYVGDDGHRHAMDKKGFAARATKDTLSWLTIGRDGYLKPCPCCQSRRVYLSDYRDAAVCFKCMFTGPTFVHRDANKKRKISRKQQIHWWNSIPRKGFYGT